ncbi:MAG TPA: lysylphosphatidylglycerol synthase transmembrane domain-containing protein [Solirubrobacterales bacterium]|nr:lysylphosphatidylglycerol synthase transmembrane domain-containing protein [Solirubrobacterales bacterium]
MPIADLASSFNAFFESAATFFRHLSEVRWTPLAIALLLLAAMEVARAWSWRNTLRTAYPQASISFPSLCAAYLAGAGVNAIAPARAGDVTKVFLAKRQVADSSYPAVTSSFLVLSIFDTAAGLLVLLYAVSQGLLPQPPTLPNLPAFEISFWAAHPEAFLITAASLILALAVAVFLLAHRVRRFWERVRQGAAILTRPRRYLREVAAWQAVGWLCRFAAFWFFLEAFGIGPSVGGVMLVMSVQAISTIVPLTPGGAGAQQALLVATLGGPSRAAVLSFSVGTQIAMAAWSVALGFGSMLLVFRTTDWRGLIRQAETDAAATEVAVPVQN